ncbi:hypothetical protein LCGC14_1353930 [marine sediment metagenome]|uniref:Uncharacterized protein n=1 Tax=marine sediment metagenome TaxID=412755 RepID=A0A0F9K9Z7_9ZZZZ
MYPPKERAAKLLAVGESIADVAKALKKSEQTVKLWLIDPEFRQIFVVNLGGAALRIIGGYLTDEHSDKDKAMVALALLRMNKPPPAPTRNGRGKRDTEDETDIDGFSEDQLRRLEGDD